MAVFFLFLRNVLLPIEILKIKILEHSDPPSQHFSVHKAFSHFYFCRGKVMLCHLAEWHRGSGGVVRVEGVYRGLKSLSLKSRTGPSYKRTIMSVSYHMKLFNLCRTVLPTSMLKLSYYASYLRKF